MAINYFKSKDVKVFPASWRGNDQETGIAIDPEARMPSEYNLLHIGNTYNQQSFIIEYNKTQNILKCVIGGYYFELSYLNNYTLANKYLAIKLRSYEFTESESIEPNEDRTTWVLDTYEDDGNTLDIKVSGVYEFHGLAILDELPTDSGSDQISASGILAAYLKPFDSNGDIDVSQFLPYNMIKSGTGVKEEGRFKYTDALVFGLDGGQATGQGSIAQGKNTLASGNFSHAEGDTTKAVTASSHAEGYKTIAGSKGTNGQPDLENAHAEGYQTKALGANSHAEGAATTADGASAHAEGQGTTASNSNAHSEGRGTTASGADSHAEGALSTASGQGSHAEGYNTQATGAYSHAEGKGTIASSENQTVVGKYNKEVTNAEFIIGYGNDADNPKNSLVAKSNEIKVYNNLSVRKDNDNFISKITEAETLINSDSVTINSDSIILNGKTTEQLKIIENNINLELAEDAGSLKLAKANNTTTATLAADSTNINTSSFKVTRAANTSEVAFDNDGLSVKHNKDISLNSTTKISFTGTNINLDGIINYKTDKLVVNDTTIISKLGLTQTKNITLSDAATDISFNGATANIKYKSNNVISANNNGISIGTEKLKLISSSDTFNINTADIKFKDLTVSETGIIKTLPEVAAFEKTIATFGYESSDENTQINIKQTNENDAYSELEFIHNGIMDNAFVFRQQDGNNTHEFYALDKLGFTRSTRLYNKDLVCIGEDVLDENGGVNWETPYSMVIQPNQYDTDIVSIYGSNNSYLKIDAATCGIYTNSSLNVGTLNVSTGNLNIGGTITAESFKARSDRRLKENLIEYTTEKSILDLPIYKYDFINGTKNQIGCIAQDLKEICPELVSEDANGYLTIQESKLVYLLLLEIKKLKAELKK